MLEAGLNADNSFLTLTYKDDPYSLNPLDHRRFLDALRKRLRPLQVRFYGVGEYGDLSQRPHFHYALFGYPSCKHASTKPGKYRCCSACDLIEDVWGKGLIKNLPLEIGSARYIARYVIKKMTRWDDPRLGNRHPEFARMSLKPGIGHHALKQIALVISRYNLLTPEGDVPVTLRHGTTYWPLGRYLRKKLRKELGLNEVAPQYLSAEASHKNFHSEQNAQMRSLQQTAIANQTSLKEEITKHNESKRQQIQKRLELFVKSKDKHL